MKFLANENFPLASTKYLKNKGFDIISVGTHFQGITDKEVIELAEKESRTILTFDRDYGELIFKYGNKPSQGVIYLRLVDYKPKDPGKIIETIVSIKNFVTLKKLTVFDGETLRQRDY
jgi:predicted nuclease of predicted toxin-antitoxin system